MRQVAQNQQSLKLHLKHRHHSITVHRTNCGLHRGGGASATTPGKRHQKAANQELPWDFKVRKMTNSTQLDPNCVFDTWLLGNLWYLWCVYLILAPGQTTHSSLLKFCISKLDFGFSTSDFPWSSWWFCFQILVSQPIRNHQMPTCFSIFLVGAAQCPSLG